MKNSKITADELRSYQKRSLWQEIWRNYRKSPSAMIGLIIIAIIVILAIVSQFIYDYQTKIVKIIQTNGFEKERGRSAW